PAHQADKQLCLLVGEPGSARNVGANGSERSRAYQVRHVARPISRRDVLTLAADAGSDGFEGRRILSRNRACENASAQWSGSKIVQCRQQQWQGQIDPALDGVAAQLAV